MSSAKRWKCTVCDYIHTGENPPDVCPVCKAGKEVFVLLEDGGISVLSAENVQNTTLGTTRSAIEKISYGLYILTSRKGAQINGQCINTAAQLTSTPLQLSICVNKNNFTHEFLLDSGVFALSILGQNHINMVKQFGYKSGRTADKFAGVEYVSGTNGCPILKDAIAFLECSIQKDKMIDVGTHTLFLAGVNSGSLTVEDKNIAALTYDYFHRHKQDK